MTSRRAMRTMVPVVVVALVGIVGYGVWWVSSERALGFVGTGGGGAIGMRTLPPSDTSAFDSADEAPPTFGWRRGGRVFYGWLFHNSLSVPVTVTGLAGYGGPNAGLLTAPRLYQPKPGVGYASLLSQIEPLHDLRIGAGSDRELVLVWHVRGVCRQIASRDANGSMGEEVEGVGLRYTMLGGLFSESQWVPMVPNAPIDGSQGYLFGVQAPRIGDCPAGYPAPKVG